MPSKNVFLGGEAALTESDLKEQDKKIKKQEKEIKKLKIQRIYFTIIGALLSQAIYWTIWYFLMKT